MPVVNGIIWPELHYVRPIFLALHISGGLVGMPLLVATFLLAKNVHKRQPVFINFCISWSLYSLVYVLLGHTGKPISFPLCYIQTAFILGAPPMTALSTTLVVFKIWWTFRTSQNTEYHQRPRWLKILSQITLLGSPYFVFIVYTIISIGLQILYPGTFDERNGIYCTAYGVNQRQWLVPLFCVLCVIFMILFQTLLIIRYYKNKRKLVRSFPLLDKSTSRSLVIRVGFFNLYLCVSFGMGIEFFYGGDTAWPYMIQAGLPLACFLAFGTQKDVLVAWKILRDPTSTARASGTGQSASVSSFRRPPPDEDRDFAMNSYPRKSIQIHITHQTSDYHIDKVYDGSHNIVTFADEPMRQNQKNFIPVALPNCAYDLER